jgi:ankyrin repeat protein
MTRMWTYQEIKLATNAVIATRSGFVGFDTITRSLKSFALNEVGEGYMQSPPGKYPSLCNTLRRLQRDDEVGVSLADLAIGCGYRQAWDQLDYARALFPTLGAEWKVKYDIHQAMQKIYLSQRYNATCLALFHGPPRASYPGWAPAVFNGLTDTKIIEAGIWKGRGMQRSWLTAKIKSIVPNTKPGRLALSLESDFAEGALTVGFISESENPKSIEFFRKAVREGTAYLLADEPLVPIRHFSRIGLLVARFLEAEDLEAWVCITFAVGETQETSKFEKLDWLLLHENPVSDEFMSGKSGTELVNAFVNAVLPGAAESYAQFPLHQAARGGDVEECGRLLATVHVNTIDSRGWTALHVAAAADQRNILPLLIDAGADVNVFDFNGQSPLCLAIENFHNDAVVELWEAGADVNASHEAGFSPLCTAARRGVELTSLLIALGANPSLVDAGGWSPLCCAINDQDGESETLEALLEAGGDPNVRGGLPLFPLEIAVRNGNALATRMLLASGANPNLSKTGIDPPLYEAIISGNLETVRALVDNSADCKAKFRNGRTPMMLAAEGGDHEIGRILQSKGASLNETTSEGLTSLHIAAMSGSRIFYKWLLEEGADKSVKDTKGKTATELKIGFEYIA